MKAAVFIPSRTATDPFLQIRDVPRPLTQQGQILIRVIALSLIHILSGVPIDITHQVSGSVEYSQGFLTGTSLLYRKAVLA